MKDLMNKVTEAKMAAEANLVARRAETATMHVQANTAKLLRDNPTLMRIVQIFDGQFSAVSEPAARKPDDKLEHVHGCCSGMLGSRF